MAKPTVETEQHSLYNGELLIHFYPKSHKYKVDGSKDWLTSVSTITGIVDKPFLKQWAVNCAIDSLLETFKTLDYQKLTKEVASELIERTRKEWENVSQIAKDSGTSIHEYCEKFIAYKTAGGEKPEMPTVDDVLNSVSAFLKWNSEHDIEYVHSEKLVYSREHNYVGIFDVLFTQLSERSEKRLNILGDFKSSKRIYAEYVAQTIGYAIAYEEETGVRIDGVAVLRFDKASGEFEVFYVYRDTPEWDKGVLQFMSCLNLKRANSDFEKLISPK